MIKPALILTWPVHVDFPFFRWMIKRHHDLFEDIIVIFSNENQIINYKAWILHDISFIKPVSAFLNKPDWRDDAVNSALTLETKAHSYVFFEPDFLIERETFWNTILSTESEFVYYSEEGRFHPAFSVVSRNLINKTSKDFSAHPDDLGLDHFGLFFQEVQKLDKGKEIRELGLQEKIHFYHMAGTTQNYWNAEHDEPLYKSKEFIKYNYLNMLLPKQHMSFYKRELDIAEKYGFPEKPTFLNTFFPEERDL